LGFGDWVLGFGDWVLGPIPNPQSPIPNPQSPIPNDYLKQYFIFKIILNKSKQLIFKIILLYIYKNLSLFNILLYILYYK